ncbi:MAG TPA: hypothetical protein DCM05_16950 [Elusimicrobia bacterium]|nr:hypothetical protein [Elusimicrobiota bacterium]
MTRVLLAAALLAPALFTADAAPKPEGKPVPVETSPIRNLLVEFRLEFRGQTLAHRVLAQENTQNTYAVKDPAGSSVLINSTPAAVPNSPGLYSVQFQFQYRSEKGAEIQLQNEIVVREGKDALVLDDTDARLTLKVAPKDIE